MISDKQRRPNPGDQHQQDPDVHATGEVRKDARKRGDDYAKPPQTHQRSRVRQSSAAPRPQQQNRALPAA